MLRDAKQLESIFAKLPTIDKAIMVNIIRKIDRENWLTEKKSSDIMSGIESILLEKNNTIPRQSLARFIVEFFLVVTKG